MPSGTNFDDDVVLPRSSTIRSRPVLDLLAGREVSSNDVPPRSSQFGGPSRTSAMVGWLLLLLSFRVVRSGHGSTGGRSSPAQPDTDSLHAARIKIIGAGLGRTGTMSLQEALRILGYRTYHMEEFIKDPSHPAAWRSFADGHSTAEALFHKITEEGYNATMDNPMCDVYADQLRMFPDAKVVLTQHPKGSAGWYKSFSSLLSLVRVQSTPASMTYPNFFSFIPMFQDINVVRCLMGTITMGLKRCELMYRSHGKPLEWWQKQYDNHNAHVKNTVPSERLLVFDVSQGWEPLCRFLEVPVPDRPFPHSNESGAIRRLSTVLVIVIYAWVPCLVLLIVFLYRRCCCSRVKAKAG